MVQNSITLVSFLHIPYDLQMKTRKWRNSENVTKYFKIPSISVEQHKKWLASLHKEKPTSIAFMIYKGSQPIGVTYFHSIDYDQKTADWGIYIYYQKERGLGIGKIVIEKCMEYAKETLKLSIVYLDVLCDNFRAIHLYEKVGFKQIQSDDLKFLRYHKSL